MAIAFFRTMRSLSADDFRGPRIVWLVAVVILGAWAWWFFSAQVPVPNWEGGITRVSPAKLMWHTIGRAPESSPPKEPAKQ